MNAKTQDESTYYQILEISSSASPRDVLDAYNRAKETYSPDSPALYTMFSGDEARQLLKFIEEAFNVLSNQAKRKEYDHSLAVRGNKEFASRLKDVNHPGTSDSTMHSSQTRDDLPGGFARTKFGVYEIDEEFEKQIAEIDECDGNLLLKIRQYKKISIEQMSDATRVNKGSISAVEKNEFQALPAPVFVRGFVIQIARTLGLNDKTIADAYMKYFRKQNGG